MKLKNHTVNCGPAFTDNILKPLSSLFGACYAIETVWRDQLECHSAFKFYCQLKIVIVVRWNMCESEGQTPAILSVNCSISTDRSKLVAHITPKLESL